MNTENHFQSAAFLWSIADLLRGDFNPPLYGRTILPFPLLRRTECVLEPTKNAVIRESYAQEGRPDTGIAQRIKHQEDAEIGSRPR